jgi:DNA-binding Xre family transcriptional regulator
MIRIDADKLKEIANRRGFANLEEVAKKADEMGLSLALSTIYSIAGNGNWTRDKLETLCRVLNCDPRDFVFFEREAPKAIAPTRRSGRATEVPA